MSAHDHHAAHPHARSRKHALSRPAPADTPHPSTDAQLTIPCAGKPTPPCCIKSLLVRCDHADRAYTISVPADAPNRESRHVLQICSTHETPDQLRLVLGGGPCVRGKPGVGGSGALVASGTRLDGFAPLVSVSGPGCDVVAASPFKVKAAGAELPAYLDLPGMWALVTSPWTPTATYAIGVDCCEGGGNFDVLVETFTPLAVSGTLEWGFAVKGDFKDKMGREEYSPSFEDTGEFETSGGFQVKIGEREYGIGRKSTATTAFSPIAAGMLFRSISFVFEPLIRLLVYLLNDESGVTLKLPAVELEIAATMKEKEEPADWWVDWETTIAIGLKPLLGCEVRIDIAEHLLRLLGTASSGLTGPCGPMLAKALIAARRRLKTFKGRGSVKMEADVGIDLIIGGSVEGKFEWRLSGARPALASGAVETPVAIKLKGYGKLEVRRWKVGVGASAELGAKTRFGARIRALMNGRNPGTSGQFFFDGVTIYFVYELSIGTGKVADKPKPPPRPGEEDWDHGGKGGDTVWQLLGPATWPSDPAVPVDLPAGDF